MIFPSYDFTDKLAVEYEFIPVCKEIYADTVTPIALLLKLSETDKNYYLLESVEEVKMWGRYSFIGYDPLLIVYGKDHKVTVKSNESEQTEVANPYEVLKRLLNQYKSPQLKELPPFTGGFVGYFSYEMIRYAEPKLKLKQNDIFYDFYLMLFHKVIAFDHLQQKIYVICNYKTKEKKSGYDAALLEIDQMIQLIQDSVFLPKQAMSQPPVFSCNLSKEEYCAMVEKTKEYIKEGDIFQAVLSRRFEASYTDSLLNAYRMLRTTNPSPYMYFIHCEEFEIAGSSPETLVKLTNGTLTTFPIAGTRPRGSNEREDKELEKELLADEKECSEHNMLVDLARNDIGKLAQYCSICVNDYMKVLRFSKVMHLTTKVTGSLQKGKDALDTIAAILPAGTLSGAPKFRACEIINELEPVARGVYGGAIGYLDLSGNLDSCIAIRTAIKYKNQVYVQAGAGIVADSIPEREYEETMQKASAIIEAIVKAGEVNNI